MCCVIVDYSFWKRPMTWCWSSFSPWWCCCLLFTFLLVMVQPYSLNITQTLDTVWKGLSQILSLQLQTSMHILLTTNITLGSYLYVYDTSLIKKMNPMHRIISPRVAFNRWAQSLASLGIQNTSVNQMHWTGWNQKMLSS